jgi:hypothetical protein
MNAPSHRNQAAASRGLHLLASIVCLAGFLLSSNRPLISQTQACSQKTIDTLEDEATEVQTWPQLAGFYRRYRACKIDDASVQEGVSDSIARLLANHWDTLPQAATLFAHNPAFEKFALAGINITDSTDDLDRIDSLAKAHCPVGLSVLCTKIRKAIRENN